MNKEKLKGYLDKVKTTLGKISRKIWILIAVCLVVVLAVAAILIHNYNNRPYAVLIDQANNEEFATVLSWLQEQGITDYKTEGSGTILVPQERAVSLKAQLLQQQYSSANASPSGYFERVGALSTMVDRDRAWLLDLQDRMEQTIRQFPGVLSATVEINPGEDNGYVLYTNNVVDASAGVILTMESGKILSSDQASAIRNYVAHGVPNLNVENVSLSDTIGNTYSDFGAGNSESDSILKLRLEEEYDNRLRTQIMQALSKGYGEDDVTVIVNTTIELGNKTINRHEVELPESMQENGDGRGIIGSEFYAYEFVTPDGYATGGVVGTTTNAELPTYVEEGEARAELEGILKQEDNRIYDNTTTDTEMIIHCGTVSDVSVAVWINGTAIEKAGSFDYDDTREYIAAAAHIEPVITDEVTREQYLNWKIALKTDPFVEREEPGNNGEDQQPGTIWGIPYWVLIAAGAGLLLFVIVLTLILVLRGKKRKKEQAEQKAMEELLATAMPGKIVQIGEDGQPVIVDAPPETDAEGNPVAGANVMDLHTEQSMELRQNIRDFVDENMEVAALLLKSWMKEDGDNG